MTGYWPPTARYDARKGRWERNSGMPPLPRRGRGPVRDRSGIFGTQSKRCAWARSWCAGRNTNRYSAGIFFPTNSLALVSVRFTALLNYS